MRAGRERWVGGALLGLALAWCAAPGRAEGPPLAPGRVGIVVLRAFDPALVAAVQAGLEERLGMPSEILAETPLPRAAYYPPRRRYRAERLLDHLRPLGARAPGVRTVLGLTTVDISTTKDRHRDWGIFGLADLDGPAAVVSDFRLRRGHPTTERLRFRVVGTAVHEVGHTLGLPHCTEHRCVMNDAQGTIDTVDRGSGELGPLCRARLAARR